MSDAHIYISGNVTIHPSAAIAPSVMLQADPDSQLIVAAGACIGVGCVLHAHQGTLEVETGATLGSGVLIIGQGSIGAHACIGAMTTIINSSIPPEEIVPPGSLIGDRSRQVVIVEASEPYVAPPPPQSMPQAEAPSVSEESSPAPSSPDNHKPDASGEKDGEAQEPEQPSSAPTHQGTVQVVYGRAYLEQMMVAMFPHRQPLNDTE
jgi:carbon dioxide concentrating mechanism protein CcmN